MFNLLSSVPPEALGLIPFIVRGDDERPFAEQVEERYAHGGGWLPFGRGRWEMRGDNLRYPGDPVMRPLAWWNHPTDGSRFYVYPAAICAVVHADGRFDVVRLD